MLLKTSLTPILDWEVYVKRLAGDALRSKALQANTQRFSIMMLQEGHSLKDVEQIVLFFVRQMVAVGMMLPPNGAFDLDLMARTDPIARRGVTMTEEEAALLAANAPVDESDDFEGLAS